MCDCCNIKNGTREHLMNNVEDFVVGDFRIEQGLSVDIENDGDGRRSLVIDYIVGDESANYIKVVLNYCPFCGEKFEHGRRKLEPIK